MDINERFVQVDFTCNLNTLIPWKALKFAKLARIEIF